MKKNHFLDWKLKNFFELKKVSKVCKKVSSIFWQSSKLLSPLFFVANICDFFEKKWTFTPIWCDFTLKNTAENGVFAPFFCDFNFSEITYEFEDFTLVSSPHFFEIFFFHHPKNFLRSFLVFFTIVSSPQKWRKMHIFG